MEHEQPSLEELQGRMARLPLHVVFMIPTERFRSGTPEENHEISHQHLLYLRRLEEAGKLFGVGPLDQGVVAGRLEGMCILLTSSREEAEELAHDDPWHKLGWRVNTVRSWTLNEGVTAPLARSLLQLDSSTQ
jgi:uncharacterized protein YciI